MQQVGNRSSCITSSSCNNTITSNMTPSTSNMILVGMNELGFDCGFRGASKEKDRIAGDVNHKNFERRGR